MNLTKNDYFILDTLYNNGCFTKMCSFTLLKTTELTNLSKYKIRDSIKMFINLGLVCEGARDVRAKTYFLSSKGIEMVEENRKVSDELMARYKAIKNNKDKKGE